MREAFQRVQRASRQTEGLMAYIQLSKNTKHVTRKDLMAFADIGSNIIRELAKKGISVELIDVQTLLPFDLEQGIVESLKKTNCVLFLDEDVPGGASAYMMQEVLETQNGYRYLDCKPRTLTAKQHRPPYGDDGDYFSKPSVEDVVETVFEMVYEREPKRFS